MKEEYLTRQLDILPLDILKKRIIIIGAGAIGSFVTLTLAKMGFSNITVWDDDVVDEVNINCQFFPISSIGLSKLEVLEEMIDMFTGTKIKGERRRYEGDEMLRGDIVISAVDCMEARASIFKGCNAPHFIDSRMAAEYFAMYTVDMNSMAQVKSYVATLHGNNDAVQERCTAKSTMYTVGMIAGFVGKAVKDIVTRQKPIETLDFNIEKNGAVWFTDGKKLTM